MSTLTRDWIASALAADLTQNQLRAFLAVMHQTLCYGKASDAITDKRLGKLANVRVDRLRPALHGLVEKGIIEAQEHPYFDGEYSIPADLLLTHHGVFFAPSLPKNGSHFRKTEEPSENRVHTTYTFTTNNLTPPTTEPTPPAPAPAPTVPAEVETVSSSSVLEPTVLEYPQTFDRAEQARAANILDGLTPTTANDCLKLLAQAMQQGKVKTPHGYLYRLADNARHGTLDISTLRNTEQAAAQAIATKTATSHRAERDDIRAQISGIDNMAKLAGGLDPVTATRRAALVAQYNQLSSA